MKINNSYPCKTSRYSKTANLHRYIVIHNTANTATAKQEAQNCHNNHAESSFHFVLDDSEIYSSVPEQYTAWAVGAWSGCKQNIGNSESISIEVCSDGREFTANEKSLLKDLTLHLMQKYNIPQSNVVRHYDCHSGRKRCPYAYSGNKTNDSKWNTLRNYITKDSYRYVPVQIYRACQSDAQKWQIIVDSDGYCAIINKKFGQCLDVHYGNTSPSSEVGIWFANNSPSQRWKIQRIDNSGICKIIGKKSNLALEIKGGATDPSTPMQIYTPNDSNAQRFIIVPVDKTWNWIINVKSGMPLEIKGGKASIR